MHYFIQALSIFYHNSAIIPAASKQTASNIAISVENGEVEGGAAPLHGAFRP